MIISGTFQLLPACDLCGTSAIVVIDDPAGHSCSYCSYDLLALGPIPEDAVCRWAYDVAIERGRTAFVNPSRPVDVAGEPLSFPEVAAMDVSARLSAGPGVPAR
jgi:hypothetical protein